MTTADMDLIDILWRQDMDLGVGREMFDTNLRREHEKQRELELKKQQQQEAFEKEKQQQQQQQQQQAQEQQSNITFVVDSETGELVPVENETLAPAPQPQAQSPPQQVPQTAQEPELDIDAAMQFITQQLNNPQPEPQQQQQVPMTRQNSFEQRWEDVANLLDIIPGGQTMTDGDEDVDMTASSQNPLLQNATLPVMQPNGTDFQINPQPITVAPNDTNFTPFNVSLPAYNPAVNNSLLDLESILPVNQTTPNATAPGAIAFPINASTDSFLQDLLDEDLDEIDFSAMDLNNTDGQELAQEDERMDDASSDSAVGSMAGSHSPNDLSDSMSNISNSHYHGIEGATGGRDDAFSPTVIPKKEVHDPSFSYTDFGFSEGPMPANSSSNETDFEPYNTEANPRHVAHNHSYPLAPGQQPRERKLTAEEKRASAQMTRDEKKAKAMKIPFSIDDIIHSPVDEFNDMLTKYKLSETQLQLIRDIRRRGKNKVAAQNCRKRKMEVIQSLEDEVNGIRQERDRLLRERSRLNKGHGEMKEKYNQMYQEVFRSLRDDNGHPYDPNQFTLQQTSDGNVFLVPVNTTAPQRDHEEKSLHKRKGKKGSR